MFGMDGEFAGGHSPESPDPWINAKRDSGAVVRLDEYEPSKGKLALKKLCFLSGALYKWGNRNLAKRTYQEIQLECL